MFKDRAEAGLLLAAEVGRAASELGLRGHAVVLGVPRGGVLVAEPVAAELDAPLDVVVPRKLGAPRNPELGIGAVAPGVKVIDQEMVSRLRISDEYLDAEVARQQDEIARRVASYRRGRPPVELEGRLAVVVDDGVATGVTAMAALRWARSEGAKAVVLAVPVAPPSVFRKMEAECDRCVVVERPRHFRAVGEWYEDFEQVSDEEVRDALDRAHS